MSNDQCGAHGVLHMVRVGLFLSSYSMLFAILALRFERPPLVIGCWILAALGVAAAAWILATEKAKGPGSFEIDKIEDQGPQIAAYLASYLLPFVTLAEPSDRDAVGYVLFLLVLALVYVQSDMLQINPILYLFRRRVVKITTKANWQAYLITRRVPLPAETILATTLASGVLVRSSQGRETK
jgi:hypothetical protein